MLIFGTPIHDMIEPMSQVEILLGVNTMLLAFVSFFLRGLFARFERLENEVKTAIVNTAVESQKIAQIERDVNDLKQIVMSSLFSNKFDKK